MSEPLEKGDWRDPVDWDVEERIWELRDERKDYPNLRPDLQPLDVDDEPLVRQWRGVAQRG